MSPMSMPSAKAPELFTQLMERTGFDIIFGVMPLFQEGDLIIVASHEGVAVVAIGMTLLRSSLLDR